MSQHDFNIANQTFPSFRSDLNDALQAAATISAGATAPTTPYAYQLWYDTANEKYMIRNAANSAWLNFVGIDTNGNVDVTGNVTADGLTADSVNGLVLDTNGTTEASWTHNPANGESTIDVGRNASWGGDLNINTDTLRRMRISNNGDISFYEDTGTTAKLFWDASAESLGIGTGSPNTTLPLTVEGSVSGIQFNDDGGNWNVVVDGGNFRVQEGTAGSGPTERLRIDSSGNVGIGTSSPDEELHIATAGSQVSIKLESSSQESTIFNNTNASFGVLDGGSERMRIDSTGILMVGKTTSGLANEGHQFNSQGYAYHTRDSNIPLYVNRKTSDGTLIALYRDTVEGTIGVRSGYAYFASTVGIQPRASDVVPTNSAGTPNDDVVDLGDPSARFDDVYATNGTIQTSDANEKQQIAALTDAEITAAKAISQLFKTFKWNKAVTEKGDAARTHAGVIAQDVQAAMTAAGLDAGDYAFFISSTWWETQTGVPAVEAVDAIDAVYEDVVIPAVEEELDEDGNVIVEAQAERTEQRLVSEAVEAVEAVAAYTRTDTYDTAQEAPEGATERTRLGIRYPELMAFVGAATEQRLANIETRLTALEA